MLIWRLPGVTCFATSPHRSMTKDVASSTSIPKPPGNGGWELASQGGYFAGDIDGGAGANLTLAASVFPIADLMALVRTTAEATANDDYDLRVGIAWTGADPLMLLTTDTQGFTYDGVSTPLHHYTTVETTVNASEPAT